MGKLYDFLKKDYDIMKKHLELEQNNIVESRKFNEYLNYYKSCERFQCIIETINYNVEKIFGNNDNYLKFLKDNFDLIKSKDSIPFINIDAINDLDYEKIFNKLEEQLDNETIDFIIKETKVAQDKLYAPPTHPFDKIINDMKTELDEMNLTEEEMSSELKQELIESLDYANSSLISKQDTDYLDKVIDRVSRQRELEARTKLEPFAKKYNIDPKELEACQYDGDNFLSLTPNTNKKADTLRPLLDCSVNLSESFKQKIRDLDALVESKSIMNNLGSGEQIIKGYGFFDWFNKAFELSKKVLETSKLKLPEQRKEKIENYKSINKLSKELKQVTKEYDEVMEFIKKNFDLDKISLNGNIYSGRHAINNEDLNDYMPDLAERFDNENAPYGVILNGYSQMKGFCNQYNISIEDFLNDPTHMYLNACAKVRRSTDEKYLIPASEASLGKRMGKFLIQPMKACSELDRINYKSRSADFLQLVSDRDENTVENIILNNISDKSWYLFDHKTNSLFDDRNDNISLKNLFANGDRVDDLYTLSEKHYDDSLNRSNARFDYFNRIAEMINTDPVSECDRVLDTLKDFFLERKYILEHEKEICDSKDVIFDDFNAPRMLLAAKEYFEDYIYKNEIDLNSIRNKEEREKVVEFIQNPVLALSKKYQNENLFVAKKEEDYDDFYDQYKRKWDKTHKQIYNSFNNNFNLNNNKPNGANVGKSIAKILEDNKGGWFERYFEKTSPQYKALVNAMNETIDPDSASYGDLKGIEFYAKKYLDYKLPKGVNERDLSSTSKKRVEFCKTILKAIQTTKDEMNAPKKENNVPRNNVIVEQKKENKIENNNIIINPEFQKQLKEEIKDKDIIETNDNIEAINIKEPDVEKIEIKQD